MKTAAKAAYLATDRKWPNFVIVYQDGSRKRFSKHVTVEKAGELLKEINNRIALGTFSMADYTKGSGISIQLGRAAVQYIDERVRSVKLGVISPKTLEKDETTLLLFVQVMGKETNLSALQRHDIEGFALTLRSEKQTRYGKPYAMASIRSYLKALSSFFNWAKETGFTAENPVHGILGKLGRYAETEGIKFYSESQVTRLRAVMARRPGWVLDAFNFALWSGARVTEVLNLKAVDVRRIERNGKERTAVRLMGKGHKQRWVPVGLACSELLWRRVAVLEDAGNLNEAKRNAKNKRALELIERRFAAGYVFWEVSHRKTISEVVTESRRKAGIEEKLTFHGARHTYATDGLKQGVDLKVISALLGHTEVRTTEIYAKVLEETLLDATEDWQTS